jgi:methylated-DNA-[protein]-cysteine S-methyltransferase
MNYCLFETSLTWIGIVAEQGEVRHVRMLEGGRAAAEASLRREFPGAQQQADLLPDVQRQLKSYFEGNTVMLDAPLCLEGLTAFQQQVLNACCRIPAGQTLTYAELAGRVGRPRAARAVGNALARNPVPLLVPCHRGVAGNRRLGGFSAEAGVPLKKKLLALEGVQI